MVSIRASLYLDSGRGFQPVILGGIGADGESCKDEFRACRGAGDVKNKP